MENMCECPNGYILLQDIYIQDIQDLETMDVCKDIDECFNQTVCDHTCNNTFGSYVCSCLDGYELLDDKCVSTAGHEGSGSNGPYLPSTRPTPVTEPSLNPPAVGLLP